MPLKLTVSIFTKPGSYNFTTTKDVVLGEDRSTIRVGAGLQVVGAIRNTVLNMLRKGGYSKIRAQLRRNSRNPIEALTLLGISI